MTNSKETKGIYQALYCLRDVFGSVEHQENTTDGSRHEISLQGTSDNHVLSPLNGTNTEYAALARRVNLYDIIWYIPQDAPKSSQKK